MKKLFTFLITLLVTLFMATEAITKVITSNAVTGNWSATTSWVGGKVPDKKDNAIIVSSAHSVVWDAGGQVSGVYIVVVESGGLKDTRKITLLK